MAYEQNINGVQDSKAFTARELDLLKMALGLMTDELSATDEKYSQFQLDTIEKFASDADSTGLANFLERKAVTEEEIQQIGINWDKLALLTTKIFGPTRIASQNADALLAKAKPGEYLLAKTAIHIKSDDKVEYFSLSTKKANDGKTFEYRITVADGTIFKIAGVTADNIPEDFIQKVILANQKFKQTNKSGESTSKATNDLPSKIIRMLGAYFKNEAATFWVPVKQAHNWWHQQKRYLHETEAEAVKHLLSDLKEFAFKEGVVMGPSSGFRDLLQDIIAEGEISKEDFDLEAFDRELKLAHPEKASAEVKKKMSFFADKSESNYRKEMREQYDFQPKTVRPPSPNK